MYSGGSSTSYPDNSDGMIAMANASRDAAIVQSNNNLLAVFSQNAVMELGITESANNNRFQMLAWLTERLDAHDVRLQIVEENARLAITQEENRFKLADRELDIREAEANRPESFDTSSILV